VLGLDALVSLGRLHVERALVDEARGAVEEGDPIALELRAHDLALARHHRVHAKGEVGERDGVLQRVVLPIERALLESAQVENRLAQRLRRDGAGMETRAPDARLAVDHRHALAELGGGDGALLSGGAGTDDDEIEGGDARGPACEGVARGCEDRDAGAPRRAGALPPPRRR
jgi:hypothetical protein